jgi:hypothetical protein
MTRQLVRLDQLLALRPWLTDRWVRRLVNERRIPVHKAGDGPKARLIFDLGEIDEWIEKGRVEARPALRAIGTRRRSS